MRGNRTLRRTIGSAVMGGVMLATVLCGPAQAVPPAKLSPTDVLATFTGSVKGLVQVSEVGTDDARVWITLTAKPSGTTRLIGSTAPCSTPTNSGNRAFSVTYEDIKWVRQRVDGLLPGGVDSLRSLRFVRPGSPSTQVACRAITAYVDADAFQPTAAVRPSALLELTNTLVSSYRAQNGPRGQLAVGPVTDGKVSVRAAFQRLKSGVDYRLVGSTKACGSTHNSANTLFDKPVPSSGFVNSQVAVQHQGSWKNLTSVRLFRGSGYGQQTDCIIFYDVMVTSY